jgi:hypothetical membrane protein
MAKPHTGNSRLQWPDRFGALVWLAGIALFFALHVYAESAWKDPVYSWAANNISDLGNVQCQPWGDDRRYVCSPRHDAMNAGFVLQGAAMLIGLAAVSLRRSRSARTWSAGALLLAAGAGWILAGVWPADVDENRHVLGALLIMILGNIGLALGPAVPGEARRIRWAAPVLGAVGLAGAALFFTGSDLGLGPGGMERVAAYPLPAWMLITGLALLFGRRPRSASAG